VSSIRVAIGSASFRDGQRLAVTDCWAQWLRVRRDGGSVEQRRAALEFLTPTRDQILDRAEVKPGEGVLDVGCGDGLVGLGALDCG
jgi:arsenite methyltransferase